MFHRQQFKPCFHSAQMCNSNVCCLPAVCTASETVPLQWVSFKNLGCFSHLLYMQNVIHHTYILYIYISYTIHYNISFPKEMGNTNCRTSFEGIGNCFKAGNGGLKYLKQPCDSTRWNGTVGQVISCNTALVKGRGIPSPIIKLTNCNVTLAFNMSIIENKQLDTIGLVRS